MNLVIAQDVNTKGFYQFEECDFRLSDEEKWGYRVIGKVVKKSGKVKSTINGHPCTIVTTDPHMEYEVYSDWSANEA